MASRLQRPGFASGIPYTEPPQVEEETTLRQENAQLRQKNQELTHQLIGTLKELKEAMEKNEYYLRQLLKVSMEQVKETSRSSAARKATPAELQGDPSP